jgi:hypothetical protein
MLAGIVRKVVRGSRVTTVARLDTAPRDDSLFTVPAGWKRELKKD